MSDKSLLDQYYTKPEVAEYYSAFIKERFGEDYKYFEPSAGEGAFSSCFKNITSIDIEPKFDGCIRGDFLSYTPDLRNKIVVGNPPFGKNSSLALKFLNKASEFSDFVAFILPKTFKKQSFINKISPQLHLVAELDLPVNSFIFNYTPYDVPCVFQIWQKKSEPRHILNLSKSHPDFEFTDKQNADFAIRRVGVLAGKVITDFQSYSEQSHYYIKSHIPIHLLIQKLTSISWDSVKYNTAGNPSISKSELIQLYSKI